MEEIEGIFEAFEDYVDGADEAAEDLTEEEQAELEREVAEAKNALSELSEQLKSLKEILQNLKSARGPITKWLAKNIAIGAIFWGVSTGLTRLLKYATPKEKETKRTIISALKCVINSETDLSKKTLSWTKDHKDDMITLETYPVPLECIMAKYLTPVSKAVEEAFDIAERFQTKIGGKVQPKLPNAGDITQFLTAAEAFHQSFSHLITFISENKDKFQQLASFPVTQDDMKELNRKIGTAQALPLW
ncbi:uncharacterized protein LOC133423588 [Cololabis saira]|uniref:uncharacterized protein LOC133423588 n=1 Tax=Cololabis saira TaxID=129043 RepID=UPI002AD41CCD|nr:uncharacterized protein LOC133423588 [Cololabis saira]